LTELARTGDAKAFYNIGIAYQDGVGVAQNDAQATRWFKAAADKGLPEAQYNLGWQYDNGRGVAQDYKEAARWYEAAARQGLAIPQTALGSMYLDGLGVPKDHKEAVRWWRAAANQGYAPAQREMQRDLDAIFSSKDERPSLGQYTSVALKRVAGTFIVPVLVNNVMTLDFTIDSGATDVSIPADVVLTLLRTGTLHKDDFFGQKTYTLADGTTIPSQTFSISSLKIGDKVVENVTGGIAPVRGSLLLGQSFLSRFQYWSIDNQREVLVLEDAPQ
jgi:predicted aspartyl protease